MENIIVFPHKTILSDNIYKDFENKLDCSKLQVNVFECICDNIHFLETESSIPIYYLEDKNTYMTYPFFNVENQLINPLQECKKQFINSNFMFLIYYIKKFIHSNLTEMEVNYFIFSFVTEVKELIKKKYVQKFGVLPSAEFQEFKIGLL